MNKNVKIKWGKRTQILANNVGVRNVAKFANRLRPNRHKEGEVIAFMTADKISELNGVLEYIEEKIYQTTLIPKDRLDGEKITMQI